MQSAGTLHWLWCTSNAKLHAHIHSEISVHERFARQDIQLAQ
jgi:hypothetical protein